MTPPDDEGTGLPGLRSWRGIYVFVIVAFVAWVTVLTWLDWVFP